MAAAAAVVGFGTASDERPAPRELRALHHPHGRANRQVSEDTFPHVLGDETAVALDRLCATDAVFTLGPRRRRAPAKSHVSLVEVGVAEDSARNEHLRMLSQEDIAISACGPGAY